MNRNDRKRIMLVSIVLLAVVISGFSAMTNAAAPQPQTKAAGGVLNIAMQQDLPNFNDFDLSSNTVWKSNVIGWNFESLMAMDRDGSAYPLLAQKVVFDEKTLTATIYLRHNVTFQDGTPMTAKDVIFSYCALRQGTTVSGTAYTIPFDDNNDGTVSFQEIKNHVKYVNAYEVKISTRQPYNYFFLGTLGLPIIPEHIWKNHLVPATSGGSTSVDSEGYTAGIVDVSWNNDPKATIGTGPWMYGGGVKDSYRIEKPYSGYWGKDFRTPDGYPNWNANITEMKFKIYANLDTAVLALQTGEVDYIAWAIEPGKVPVLQKDPNIDLHYMADNGYFYLAFNEKTQPANDLAFRHAVSHVIDKKTAVQRYLGGYGQAGDSAEPPFFTAWYNASVQHYPYDLNTAKKILDGEKVVADNGYVEQDPAWGEKYPVGPSGWRTLPDGTPMKPITLFTPPADYDPVRIKVGQGIAQNLRSLGVNIQAKPVDFDTLVAYMQSYNYQMLELGWSLSSDPIGNLADILGPKAIQNTYGWWNASDPNPYYVNAGGVNNTLADKMSQDSATQFQKVINTALTTFNVTKQIKYTKWAQDIVAKTTVINVLYYKLNIEATRKSWTGWVEWQGTVFNGLSLGMLHKGSAPVPPPTPGKSYMSASLNVPGRILLNGNGTGSVYVMNSKGAPVADANVALSANSSIMSVSPATGKTNANGVFTFKMTGTGLGMSVLNVAISKDGYSMVNKTATVQVVDKATPVLTAVATADKMSLSPGASTGVTVTVKNQYGQPVSGATVSVDPNLVGFGTVSPATATTDANGQAKFTYVAPNADELQGKYVNMHTVAKLVFSIAKQGYAYSNTPILQLITYNNFNSSWIVYKFVTASQYVVSPTLGWDTNITVEAMNAQGQPLVNEAIPISYSDSNYIVNETNTVVTNSTGYATFTVQFKPGLPTAPVYINFINNTIINGVGDRLDILYYNGTGNATGLYGGYIDIASSIINETSNFTVHLYNVDNKPAASGVNETVPLAVVVSGTTDGQLVDLDDQTNNGGWYFNSAWYYTGIGIYTPHDNIATSGDFIGYANRTPNPFDGGLSTWNETEVQPALLHNGTVTIGLPLSEMSYRDLLFNVFVVPYGDVYLYISDPSWSFYQFNITGQQVFESQAVVHRAMDILISSVSIAATATPGQPFNVGVTVYNQDDTPVSGVTVTAYNNAKSWKAIYPAVSGTTDKNGTVTLTPTAPVMSAVSEINVFVLAQGGPNSYSVLESTTIPVVPPYLFMTITPVSNEVVLGGVVAYNVEVTDSSGAPVAGVAVKASPSLGSVTPNVMVTGPDGTATFLLNTADMNPANVTEVLTSVSISVEGLKDGYNPVASTTGAVLIKGYVPVLSVGLANGATVYETNYKVVGYVYDAYGIKNVTVSIDGASYAATVKATNETVVVNGVTYKVYEWSYQFNNLKTGDHTLKVTAFDDRGMEASSTLSFSVSSSGSNNTTPAGGAIVVGGIDLWIIITIILLIVVVIMGAMLAKKPKAAVPEEEPVEEEPESEAVEESEEEEPAEEEQAEEEGGEEL